MRKKSFQAFKNKSLAELWSLGIKTRLDLGRLKVELKAGKLKNRQQLVSQKKDLARIKTVIKERQFHETT